jgi:hypothetical protein
MSIRLHHTAKPLMKTNDNSNSKSVLQFDHVSFTTVSRWKKKQMLMKVSGAFK